MTPEAQSLLVLVAMVAFIAFVAGCKVGYTAAIRRNGLSVHDLPGELGDLELTREQFFEAGDLYCSACAKSEGSYL